MVLMYVLKRKVSYKNLLQLDMGFADDQKRKYRFDRNIIRADLLFAREK